MQDSLVFLCCGAIFGVLAVVIVLALLKRRGTVTVLPPSAMNKPSTKSVEGKHLAPGKSVEGKHLAEGQRAKVAKPAEDKQVGTKHRVDPVRSKSVLKKHVAPPTPSKSDYHPAEPKGDRSKSTYKHVEPDTRDAQDDNPRFRKS